MAVRAIAMLPCITGSWKEVGGGLQLSTSGAFPAESTTRWSGRPDEQSRAGRPARVINMAELGRALNELQAIRRSRRCSSTTRTRRRLRPTTTQWCSGLLRHDLFTVVHEQFLTDTCDYADMVLPATTFFEHKDLQKAYGHYYLQISNQAIAPLGEAKSNVELFSELAQRFGFEEDCFRESPDDIIDSALNTNDPWLDGIDRQRLETDNHVRLKFGSNGNHEPFLPFANGGFYTRSGKAELYNENLINLGLDPVAAFKPLPESRHGNNGHAKYPFELLARKADNFLNSTFANQPGTRAMENPNWIEINPQDAAARNISDGQAVRIFNDRGEIRLTAKLTDTVQPGVLGARLDWAKHNAEGANINVLTSDRLTDLGAGATFYTVLVEVQPF